MEYMILLGGLLVFALVGFWMMGRVDRFLNAARAEQEGRQHAECLKIAASDPCVMQPVFKTVSALKEQHPDLWCELSFGREAEVLGCLSTGNVDVAILPGETGGGAAFESRDFLFSPVSFRAVEDWHDLVIYRHKRAAAKDIAETEYICFPGCGICSENL